MTSERASWKRVRKKNQPRTNNQWPVRSKRAGHFHVHRRTWIRWTATYAAGRASALAKQTDLQFLQLDGCFLDLAIVVPFTGKPARPYTHRLIAPKDGAYHEGRDRPALRCVFLDGRGPRRW